MQSRLFPNLNNLYFIHLLRFNLPMAFTHKLLLLSHVLTNLIVILYLYGIFLAPLFKSIGGDHQATLKPVFSVLVYMSLNDSLYLFLCNPCIMCFVPHRLSSLKLMFPFSFFDHHVREDLQSYLVFVV